MSRSTPYPLKAASIFRYVEDLKAWFVSDIHIANREDSRLAKFEDFLRARLIDGTTHLFLVGDIFDLWVGGDKFFANQYRNVVDLIGRLKLEAVDVIYFEGNHDLHLQTYWHGVLNCRVAVAPQYFDLGLHRVRVEHGDQMNPDDKGYLFLREVLRTSFVKNLVKVLPGKVIQAIGNSMSRSSRKYTSSPSKARNEAEIRSMIRTHAARVFAKAQPFDLLVTGHVHTIDDSSWTDGTTGKTVRSVNLGCWLPNVTAQAFCLDESGGRFVAV